MIGPIGVIQDLFFMELDEDVEEIDDDEFAMKSKSAVEVAEEGARC
jgi:hypothetical protein